VVEDLLQLLKKPFREKKVTNGVNRWPLPGQESFPNERETPGFVSQFG